MSDIGAQLPPHLLAKRKRQQEENARDQLSAASGAKAPSAPASPEEAQEKRRRIAGPAMPPAPIEERPTEPVPKIAPKTSLDESDSSDYDDFGPAAPSASDGLDTLSSHTSAPKDGQSGLDVNTEQPKLQRDEWMTMAPTADGLASRMDPLKQRPRGFNTGKGAKSSTGGTTDSSTWHETAEQKQKRLQDEMMGIAKPNSSTTTRPRPDDKQKARELRDKLNKHRGPSLMDQHKTNTAPDEAEDDPSKRAFDREKDMGSGARISASQKREMLNKAADFSSRFSGGSFL